MEARIEDQIEMEDKYMHKIKALQEKLQETLARAEKEKNIDKNYKLFTKKVQVQQPGNYLPQKLSNKPPSLDLKKLSGVKEATSHSIETWGGETYEEFFDRHKEQLNI
ncbi:hypothetical protein J6590_009077 [Homalodisca vitripennis]|nr:hypothetical protein J6590_009077 [Homalodisca vitripennis]